MKNNKEKLVTDRDGGLIADFVSGLLRWGPEYQQFYPLDPSVSAEALQSALNYLKSSDRLKTEVELDEIRPG